MSISRNDTFTMGTKESSLKIPVNSRASKFIGVSKSKGKGDAYVAAILDKEKGYAVHLGTFVDEEEAARARDIVAFKYLGPKAGYNFPMSDYKEILKLMENMTKERVMATIKRCSGRFARSSVGSNYRGVSWKPQKRRWQAIKGVRGTVSYLGCFATPEEAAISYDVEAIKVKGWNALTNFDIKLYNVEAILAESSNPSSAKDRAKFVKKELLDMPQKYIKGTKKHFLEKIRDQLGVATVGPGETSNAISSQPLNFVENQLSDSANVEECGIQIEQKLDESPPYHFPVGAGSMFRHSSSSCFKPYKKTSTSVNV